MEIGARTLGQIAGFVLMILAGIGLIFFLVGPPQSVQTLGLEGLEGRVLWVVIPRFVVEDFSIHCLLGCPFKPLCVLVICLVFIGK